MPDRFNDRTVALHELNSIITEARQAIQFIPDVARREARKYQTVIVLLLVLGAVGFGYLAFRQESITTDLRKQAFTSCSVRNENEANLRQTWVTLAADSDNERQRQDFLAAAERIQFRDCTVFLDR